MDVMISWGTIFLAALTHASLQLGLGGLLLLYHSSQGKHIKKKTKDLVGSYISGVGMLVFFVLAAFCFIIDRFFNAALNVTGLIIVVAALISVSIVVWAFYFRVGKSTELWLPKAVTRFIGQRAKTTTSNTEAFCLGSITGFAEMPFSIILMVVAANYILSLPFLCQLLGVAFYTLIVILPYVIFRYAVRNGQTVVDIQKWRVKNKNFFRVLAGTGFFVLGLFLLVFEVLA